MGLYDMVHTGRARKTKVDDRRRTSQHALGDHHQVSVSQSCRVPWGRDPQSVRSQTNKVGKKSGARSVDLMAVRVLWNGSKFEITLSSATTVRDFKALILDDSRIHHPLGSTIASVRLILNARLLKDEEELKAIKMDRHSSITVLFGGTGGGRLVMPRGEQTRVVDDLDGGHVYPAVSGGAASSLTARSRFGQIDMLPNLAMSAKASAILHELANDAGFVAVMEKNDWRVGALCELYPEGQVGVDPVCVLGLNENKGQRILLRIRTDDLLGFRSMVSIRATLCHELAHNVYGDHDDKFYILMRQIERDVVALDWRKSKGQILGGDRGARYEAFAAGSSGGSSASSASGGVHVLGGSASLLPPGAAAANSALLRRTQAELDMESTCGCSHPERTEEILSSSPFCLPCPAPAAAPPAGALLHSIPADGPTTEQVVVGEKVEVAEEFCDWKTVSEVVLAHIDEGIALCFSTESSAAPLEHLFRIRESLSRILSQGSNEDGQRQRVIQGLSLLRLIVGNARELGLADPKFREINTEGFSWRTKIAWMDGARDLLLVGGFSVVGSKLVYSRGDDGLLYIVFDLLSSCIDQVDTHIFAM